MSPYIHPTSGVEVLDIIADVPIYTSNKWCPWKEIEASKHSSHKRRSGIYTPLHVEACLRNPGFTRRSMSRAWCGIYTSKQVTSMMRDLHVEAGDEHDAGFTRRSRWRAWCGIYTSKQVTSMMRDLHIEAGHEHDAGFTRRSRWRAWCGIYTSKQVTSMMRDLHASTRFSRILVSFSSASR